MTQENRKILVIGGTGMLGTPVARRLRQDGFDVRIMTRDAAKAHKMFDDAFEIVSGDAQSAGDLETALDGCHGVHINLRGEAELLGAKQVALIAPKMDIQRISTIFRGHRFGQNALVCGERLQVSGGAGHRGKQCPLHHLQTDLVHGSPAQLRAEQPSHHHRQADTPIPLAGGS